MFHCHAGSLPPGDRLVIGLNPPFGKDGCLADKFVSHAAKFNPRVIVLIVPPATKVRCLPLAPPAQLCL